MSNKDHHWLMGVDENLSSCIDDAHEIITSFDDKEEAIKYCLRLVGRIEDGRPGKDRAHLALARIFFHRAVIYGEAKAYARALSELHHAK